MGVTTFGLTPSSVRSIHWILCLLLFTHVSLTSGWSDVALFVKQHEMRCVLSGDMSSKAFYWRDTRYNKTQGIDPITRYSKITAAEVTARQEQERLLKDSTSKWFGSPGLCPLNTTDLSTCEPPWELRDWTVASSLDVSLLPVTDMRWESLPTIFTDGGTSSSYPITLNTSPPRVNLGLSILATINSFIYLCDGDNQYESSCYWIIINGWPDKPQSAVRRCERGSISKDGSATDQCTALLSSHIGRIGSTTDWFHIHVEWDRIEDKLTVKHIEGGAYKEFLSYTDTSQTPFTVTHAILQSYISHPILWKLHNYNVLSLSPGARKVALVSSLTPSNDKVCVSFFYRFTKPEQYIRTSLVIDNARNTVITTRNTPYENEPSDTWKEDRQIYDVSQNSPMRLEIRGIKNKEDSTLHQIAVDSVRECSQQGNVNHDVRESVVPRNNNVDVACQSLTDPSLHVKYQGPTKDAARYQALLQQCNHLYGDTYCKNTLMCDAVGCYCDAGYRGDTCDVEEGCNTPGKYGPGCRSTCGNCYGNTACDFVTGDCAGGCSAELYKPSKCTEEHLVLSAPPVVTATTATTARFQFNAAEHKGVSTPSRLIVQWRTDHGDATWTPNNYKQKTITITDIPDITKVITDVSGLLANTRYQVRALLAEDNKLPYVGSSVPSTSFSTTPCIADLTVTVSSTVTDVTAQRTHAGTVDSCPIGDYPATLTLSGGSPIPASIQGDLWYWNQLAPDTDYTLNIWSTAAGRSVVQQVVRTKESVYLSSPPKLIGAPTATTAKIEVDPAQRYGYGTPNKLIIQWRPHSDTTEWMPSGYEEGVPRPITPTLGRYQDSYATSTITLRGLTASTSYQVRVVLVDETGHKYEGNKVQALPFTTAPCKDELNTINIIVDTYDTALIARNTLDGTEESCHMEAYEATLTDTSGGYKPAIHGHVQSKAWQWTQLTPDTNYTLRIQHTATGRNIVYRIVATREKVHLTSRPTLYGAATDTSAVIQFDITQRDGVGTPTKLIVQWREYSDTTWNQNEYLTYTLTWPDYGYRQVTFNVTGLRAKTRYQVRGVLEDGTQYKYEGNKVPSLDFYTSCSVDLDVKVISSATTLAARRKNPITKDSCLLDDYTATRDSKAYRTGIAGVIRYSGSQWYWDNLQPDTAYKIIIQHKATSRIIINNSERTEARAYLRSPPTLLGATATTAKIQFNTAERSGEGEPKQLIVQWRVNNWNAEWKKTAYNGSAMDIPDVNPVVEYVVRGLRAETNYHVRGVLVDADGNKNEGSRVNNLEFKTTQCNVDLREDVVEVTTTDTSLTVQRIQGTGTEDSCPPTEYTAELRHPAARQVIPKVQGTGRWYWAGLTADTDYTLKIWHTRWSSWSNLTYQKTIKTKEKAPSRPEDLTISDVTESSVVIKWKIPRETNGDIKYYTLKYCVESSELIHTVDTSDMSCKETNIKRTKMDSSAEESEEYQISSLQPSTLYSVNVTASTVAEGPPASIQFRTKRWEPTHVSIDEPKKINNTMLSITFPPADPKLSHNSEYVVIVENLNDSQQTENTLRSTSTYFDDNLLMRANITMKNHIHWIAAKFKPSIDVLTFTIGDNTTYGAYWNRELSPGKSYRVTVLLVIDGETEGDVSRYDEPGQPPERLISSAWTISIPNQTVSDTNYALFSLFLLLLLVPVVYFVVTRHGNSCKCNAVNMKRARTLIARTNKRTYAAEMRVVLKPAIPEPSSSSADESGAAASAEYKVVSRRVLISDLAEYVRKNLSNGELQRQHALFPKGQTKPWDYGRLPQNKAKNRYGNQVAYDETRVVLNKLSNDPFSDYINANYVDGYKSSRFYIATQGPKQQTIPDFWRMVWQEQVQVISMLANLVENGKQKCEQYWPENKQQATYGLITVTTADVQMFADFIFRDLRIAFGNEQRKVTQVHFTSWPDHGIPLYPQSVATYLKKMLAIPRGSGPILVHCSAGVGRTGSIIVMDACLRMAAAEGEIDVLHYFQRARASRANMVDNFEQYKMIYIVLIECLLNDASGIDCDDDFPRKVEKLKRSGAMITLYQQLSHSFYTTCDENKKQEEENKLVYKEKNRVHHVVPGKTGRIFLSRLNDDELTSDYINAVTVDGFRNKDQFIATQFPLKTTVGDFWRMISERELIFVVVLNKLDMRNDKSMCKFWPNVGQFLNVTELVSVTGIEEKEEELWTTRIFHVTVVDSFSGDVSREWSVKMLHLKGWAVGGPTPAPAIMLKLWQETEVAYESMKPILVSCFDGSTACGLFIGLSFMIEKMKLEQECDVSLAVRTIRHNRAQFVPTKEQFQWFYDVAISYLDQFQTYANFT